MEIKDILVLYFPIGHISLFRELHFLLFYKVFIISREEYDILFRQYLEEFNGIVKTGRFVEASIKLLRWLGFDESEIDLDKLIKGVVVMKVVVRENKRKR